MEWWKFIRKVSRTQYNQEHELRFIKLLTFLIVGLFNFPSMDVGEVVWFEIQNKNWELGHRHG